MKETGSYNTSNPIFGIRPIIEAIQSGKEIDKLWIQKGLKGALFQELWELVKSHQINYQYVPVEKLNRFTRKNHQGVYAMIAPIAFQPLENLLPQVYEQGETPLFLILDRITDVRNFGAIARTAACTGVHGIIVPLKGSAPVSADALKASAGALYKIPVCRVRNLSDTIRFLQDSGVQVVACTEKAEDLLYQPDFSLPTALIMGSEEDGIATEHLKKADYLARLPLMGEIASLNVSVAAGVSLYEVMRQRLYKE